MFFSSLFLEFYKYPAGIYQNHAGETKYTFLDLF